MLQIEIWTSSKRAYTHCRFGALSNNLWVTRIYQQPRILVVIQAPSGGTHLTSLAQTITAKLERTVPTPDHCKRRVSSLRQRLVDPERGDCVFAGTHPNDVPADGLELSMTMVWVRTIFL